MKGRQSNLTEIEDNLKNIQQQVDNTLQVVKAAQNSSSSSDFMSDYNNEPSILPTTEHTTSNASEKMNEMPQPAQSVPKPWQDDKNTKFNDCCKGRVTLSFPRIMMLIQSNINKGNTSKNWSSIKEQLLDATSITQVNSVISQNALNFSANTVYGGTKKRRKGGRKRKTNRRR